MRRPAGVLLAAPALALALAAGAGAAHAARVSRDVRFTASDGVSLQTTISGQAPLAPRPTIVEFSPYGPGSGTFTPGPAYNFLLVQDRGTGGSDGRFDALGPRTQRDVAEVLAWACHQRWSDVTLGLNGFSASAIVVYDSLHEPLPCVKTAVLRSGTFELYRDLLYPGGVSNVVPGAGVLGLIGAPELEQGLARLRRNPASALDVLAGMTQAGLDDLLHPTLDRWWRRRGFRGDVNHLPILMLDGFFDVESRGAFQAFQALRSDGAHLLVVGGHDGAPAGTDGGRAETEDWFDHYLRGIDDGATAGPAVRLLLSEGDRAGYLAGDFTRYRGAGWPIPGTRWVPLRLEPDHTLAPPGAPAQHAARQSYPAAPSFPLGTDPPNTGFAGPDGVDRLAAVFPPLTQANLSELAGLSYTTRPLRADVLSAGPLDLDVRLATTAPETAIWAVLCDVWPDGSAHPLTAGRLLSSFPHVERSKSLYDPRTGALVQPYGVYGHKTWTPAGRARRYHVELWPDGNVFRRGHRIRLDLVGASAASAPGAPALNTVRVGGPRGSRLELPVLPGSDLRAALRRR